MDYLTSFFARRTTPFLEKKENDESKNENVSEIMALIDFPEFMKSVPNRWKGLPSCGPKELALKENRISFALLMFTGIIIYPIVMRLLFGLLGFVTSYQIYYKYGAVQSGGHAWGMLKWKSFHLHHWMYCALGLMTLWLFGIAHPGIVGACFGGIVHGIQFDDFMDLDAKSE